MRPYKERTEQVYNSRIVLSLSLSLSKFGELLIMAHETKKIQRRRAQNNSVRFSEFFNDRLMVDVYWGGKGNMHVKK